ncbi:hypothetical protein IAR55_006973 [Kwoniella newhampshirensis]|uniref:Uncharacterized protein n=1 Tax=Kwoniella newhampshirensis TaxID=1651941 RepID=A0AAW0YW37_9TREE
MSSAKVISWRDPQKVLRLLELVSSSDRWRKAFFVPSHSKRQEDRWLIAREICSVLFKNDDWMLDREKEGLVYRDMEGRWVATECWIRKSPNPVEHKMYRLMKDFREQKYHFEYGIDPRWTCMKMCRRRNEIMSQVTSPTTSFYKLSCWTSHFLPALLPLLATVARQIQPAQIARGELTSIRTLHPPLDRRNVGATEIRQKVLDFVKYGKETPW